MAVSSVCVHACVPAARAHQLLNGARMAKIQPELKVIQERMREAQREKRPDLMVALNNERKVRAGLGRC